MISHTSECTGHNNELSFPQKPLDQEMHCICGFSSSEGNALARHLRTCGRSTAYPTVEAAQENTVKRNMLDMLGLVRREDEDDDDDETQSAGDGALLEPPTDSRKTDSTGKIEEEPNEVDETTEQTEESTIDEPMEVDGGAKESAFNAALTLDDLATIASTAELDQTTPLCNTYQPLDGAHVPIEGDVDHLEKQQIEQFMESL